MSALEAAPPALSWPNRGDARRSRARGPRRPLAHRRPARSAFGQARHAANLGRSDIYAGADQTVQVGGAPKTQDRGDADAGQGRSRDLPVAHVIGGTVQLL